MAKLRPFLNNAMLVVLFALYGFHITNAQTIFLIDNSGSMEGMSYARKIKSFHKVEDELLEYLDSHIKDSVRVISFTDKIFEDRIINGDSREIGNSVAAFAIPKRGNSDIYSAIEYAKANCIPTNSKNRLVVISDGLQNCPVSKEAFKNQILALPRQFPIGVYYLLLDEGDLSTDISSLFDKTSSLHLIRSLKEIDSLEAFPKHQVAEVVSVDYLEETKVEAMSASTDHIWDLKWLLWVIVGLIALMLLCLLIYFSYPFLALFLQKSVPLIQRAIPKLYALPKWLFNLIFKLLPEKMKKFLQENMPQYDNYKRGDVKPSGDTEAKTLEDIKNKTGHTLKYNGGEPDFEPISDAKIELDGGLDNNIPKDSDPRKAVSIAQDNAARKLLSTESGRQKIADYVGKSPADINPNDLSDYYSWKDDSLGKRGYPLTPHETIDGKNMLWVNKNWHDVSWGGIHHNGGVSMLRSIRAVYG